MKKEEKRPIALYLLLIVLAIQSIGAIGGGLSLVLAPDGSIMQMPLSYLDGSPFTSFLIPGIILLVVLGFFPAFIFYSLIATPNWNRFQAFNIYKRIHWSWSFSLYLGIMLSIWIYIEIIFIPFDILQTIFGLVGVGLIILTLLPSNMKYFGWKG